jgi:hypothetical protein
LVYSSHDTQHNNAVALRDYLHAQARRRKAANMNATGQRSRRLAQPNR